MPLHNHIPWVHILTGERRTLIFWPELKHAVVGESVLVQLLFGVVSSADGDQLDVSGTEEPQQRRKPYILTGVLFWVLFVSSKYLMLHCFLSFHSHGYNRYHHLPRDFLSYHGCQNDCIRIIVA